MGIVHGSEYFKEIISSSKQEIEREIECGQDIELSTTRNRINVNLSG